MFRCGECGCQITTETQKGHNYLRCTKRVKKDCSQPYVREASMTRQIADAIHLVAVPTDWTDWMLAELQGEQALDAAAYEREMSLLAKRRRQVEEKLDRLLAAHLDGDISSEEYRNAKGRIVGSKQQVKDEEAAVTANRSKRFEPVTRFVKSLREATLLSIEGDNAKKRDFLRTNGSNLTLSDRELKWEPRGAWKTVENHGPFAHPNDARSIERASFAGETRPTFSIAERTGHRSNYSSKPLATFLFDFSAYGP